MWPAIWCDRGCFLPRILGGCVWNHSFSLSFFFSSHGCWCIFSYNSSRYNDVNSKERLKLDLFTNICNIMLLAMWPLTRDFKCLEHYEIWVWYWPSFDVVRIFVKLMYAREIPMSSSCTHAWWRVSITHCPQERKAGRNQGGPTNCLMRQARLTIFTHTLHLVWSRFLSACMYLVNSISVNIVLDLLLGILPWHSFAPHVASSTFCSVEGTHELIYFRYSELVSSCLP